MRVTGFKGESEVPTGVFEQLRAFAASVDGSLLDEHTWAHRHRRILALTWGLALFSLGFTLADPEPHQQALYCAALLIASAVATLPQLSRRQRELLVAVAFMFAELYVLRFVGNFTLAPLAMIILTFYQDWAPLLAACLLTVVLVLLAWIDPGYYRGTRGFAVEVPHTGLSLRAAAIILAAALSLAIWRSGTQFARDQLTGLLSRVGAERALDHELSHDRRPAVWVCDLDNFRTLNRHLGHEAGDLLLKQFGERLVAVARAQPGSWIGARLGGDTFMLAARHADDDAAVTSFAHSLEHEARARVKEIGIEGVPLTFSVGAATGVPGERGASLIRAAERNMREAKGRGSSRVVVDQRIDRSLDLTAPLLTAELYSACERRELVLYLQPLVRLADGAPVGAEALVRWAHPERGLMLPGEFLPDAERDSALTALVSREIGRQFLRTVSELTTSHGADWLSHGYAFNLAAMRLRDPLLLDSLDELLAASGLVGQQRLLQMEITEGAMMDLEHGAPAVLAAITDQGYRLALDDFGTGHSSLAHLRDFPLDSVKIDKSFIASMDRSPIDLAVIQAVADIASASGLTVVAEGVETEEQRERLLAIKPDILAQGWLYAKAMPIPEFEQWVLERKRALVV